jgi:hypothetical protein
VTERREVGRLLWRAQRHCKGARIRVGLGRGTNSTWKMRQHYGEHVVCGEVGKLGADFGLALMGIRSWALNEV